MNQITKILAALTAMSALFALAGEAADLSNTNSPEKSQYNLFNPTPDALLRPLNSDQYDTVIDAHTLDAGHVQLDAPLVNYYYYSSHYNAPGLSYGYANDEYSWTPRFRVGLCNEAEFEVNPTYSIRSDNVNGAYSSPYNPYAFNYTRRSNGFGSVGLGPTMNLWGNDSGPTALAVHPFLSVPTMNGDVLGGVAVPFALQMPRGIYLKIMTEISVTENGPRTKYGEFENNISLHKKICSKAQAYWYLSSTVTSDPASSWFGYTGFGATYDLTSNLELFGGIGFGLNSAAFDYNPRFGVLVRF